MKKRKSRSVILILLVLLFVSFSISKPSPLRPSPSKDSFISQDGIYLVEKNTGQRFRFVGGNNYNFLIKYIWDQYNGNPTRDEVFDLTSKNNITVIRFWATCSNGYWSDECLGNYKNSKDFFAKFDKLVGDAEKHNVHLIPVLCDGYSTFGRYGGKVCEVGSKANLEYKEFVKDLVSRYKDRGIILAWEIGNEGSHHCSNFLSLVNWYEDTANFIRSIDSNHLISSGEDNFGSLDKTKFLLIHSIANINFASIHIYRDDLYNIERKQADEEKINHFVSYWSNVSHEELKKPVYFGEFGSTNISLSPEFYGEFLEASYRFDVDGSIFWSWLEGTDCYTPTNAGGSCVSPTRTPFVVGEIKFWANRFSQ